LLAGHHRSGIMLRNHASARAHLLGRVHSQEFILMLLRAGDVPRIDQVFDKYHDQEIDLADACLLHLADREDINAVFTLDRRHFSVFRRANGKALRLLLGTTWTDLRASGDGIPSRLSPFDR
jgi:predicted nucleic acid-binding protein